MFAKFTLSFYNNLKKGSAHFYGPLISYTSEHSYEDRTGHRTGWVLYSRFVQFNWFNRWLNTVQIECHLHQNQQHMHSSVVVHLAHRVREGASNPPFLHACTLYGFSPFHPLSHAASSLLPGFTAAQRSCFYSVFHRFLPKNWRYNWFFPVWLHNRSFKWTKPVGVLVPVICGWTTGPVRS